MTAINGVVVRGPVVPADTADVYPTHEAKYGKGGHRSEPDEAARLAIPLERRTEGMVVFQIDVQQSFQLRGGIADVNWTQVSTLQNVAAYQADSTAGNNAALVVDFNALLAKLRTAGLMDAS